MNPYDCTNDLIDTLLKNYFSNPRYLRRNDLITIDINEFAPEYLFTQPCPQLTTINFKINSIKFNDQSTCKCCYIFRDKTVLIQENNIQGYLPPMYTLTIPEHNDAIINEVIQNNISNFPLKTYKPLEQLKSSILPFIYSGNKPFLFIKYS